MSGSVDELIESYAISLELPPGDQRTIDRIIELVVTGLSWDKEAKVTLSKIVSEKQYNGNDRSIMLLLYDVLGGKSKNALFYGIRAFEGFGRDPKKLVELENPDGLVKYAIDTADGIDELVEFKNTIISNGHFGLLDNYKWKRVDLSPTKRLANSLLLVANEIAYRLKDLDPRKLTEDESKALGWEEFLEKWQKPWNIRLQAHGAIVTAYQAKGKNVVNKESLEALAAYESLTGKYQPVTTFAIFSPELMEAYARIKYGVDKPAIGETPEELKADMDKLKSSMFWGIFDFDQYFRRDWFGAKEPEWKKQEREKDIPLEEFVERLVKDPWGFYAKQLKIVGIAKEMSYEEARSIFRKGVKERRSVFTRKREETAEYQSAMRETAAFVEAWSTVEPLYRTKNHAKTSTAQQ